MADRFLTAIGRISLAAGAASVIPYMCLYDVDGGERCIMFNRFGGVQDKEIGEGSHLYLPWFQTPFLYDIRTRPKTINTTTGTRERLSVLHKTLGPDYDERVIPSIGNEVLKAVVARYNAESLLTQRDRVSQDIREAITARARQFDILLDDVAITNLSYGKEFARAIEEKQVAQQESERIKFIVAKTEQEKKAAIVRAEGESEAATMISKSLKENGTGLIEMRRLEASKDIAESFSKSRNIMYLPSNVNMFLNTPPSS